MSNVLNGVRPWLGDHRRSNRATSVALVVPAILLVLCCGYIGWAYAEGRARTVWLVNGLDRDYDVEVNGKSVHLAALSGQAVKIAEGEIRVTCPDHSLPLVEQTCEICTPLLTRPFDQTTFVINPDRAALLYEDETLFASDIKEAQNSDHRHYFTGELLYQVSGVDYPFSEFPDAVKASGAQVHKKRLALCSEGDEWHRIRLIGNELGHDAAGEYACNQALCHPDDAQALGVAVSSLKPNDALDFVRAALEHRPVWAVWHRSYQEMMQRMHPEYDLAAEYHARLSAEPNNATLMYLLGRVTADRSERNKLFEQSTTGPSPCAFGFFALGYEALAQAKFEPALGLINKAIELAPKEQQFRGVRIDALAGLHRYGELLAMLKEQEAADPLNSQILLARVRLLVCDGQFKEASEAFRQFLERASRPENQREMQHLQEDVNALLAYAQGNLSEFSQSIVQAFNTPMARFQAALAQGHLDEAAAALSVTPNASAQDHLLLYIVGTLEHRPELANEHLKIAIAGFRKGGPAAAQVAQYLAGSEPLNPADACEVSLLPASKKVALVAFALMDPQNRRQYLEMADRLNYDKVFPYWTLKQAIDAGLAK